MIRVESKQDLKGYTEFEECILFDEDDPDFDHHLPAIPETYLVQGWSPSFIIIISIQLIKRTYAKRNEI